MAEEAKKKPDAAPAKEGAEKDDHGKKKGAGGIAALLGKTPVMLGGIMLIEAVVLFAGFKFLGGGAPRSAAGAELVMEASHDGGGGDGHGGDGKGAALDKRKAAELPILDIKAPNKQSGRTFLYDVSIYATTRGEHKDSVAATIKEREALIKDRVRTIIAQSDPEKLGGGVEPGLETLRRQVKYQLDEIVGEGLIDEVLIPRCIPYRTDY
jgi:flagellar basal body-associated protein FliL